MPGPAGRTRVVLALGAGQTLAWASSYYLPAIVAGPIARDLQVPDTAVFAAFSAGLLLAAALGPTVGRAIDRRGGRDVLCWSNLVLAAGLALLAAAQGPVGLAAAWLVIGAGIALGLYDTAFAALAGLYGQGARGAITGVTLIGGFASTIGWPATAFMTAELGWRGACLVWAGLHLGLGWPLHRLLVPEAAAPVAVTGPVPAAAVPAGAPVSRRPMVLLVCFFAATAVISSGMSALLPRVLQAGGASASGAIAAAALVGPAQVAARLVEFGVLRRVHPLASAGLAALLHPVGAAALLVLGGAGAAVFAVLHGAGNGLLTIARGTLPLAMFGPAGFGLRTGRIAAPTRVAQAGAPLLFGYVLDRFGLGVLALSAGFALAAAGALVAMRREAGVSATVPP